MGGMGECVEHQCVESFHCHSTTEDDLARLYPEALGKAILVPLSEQSLRSHSPSRFMISFQIITFEGN